MPIPVKPEIATGFSALLRAMRQPPSPAIANETESLAKMMLDQHFAGSKMLMSDAFRNWFQSGGKLMSAGDFILPRATMDQAMRIIPDTMAPRMKRMKVVRKKYPSTNPPEGA